MDAALLHQLKQTYGNVYEIVIKDKVFYVRELRRAEYRYLLDMFPENTEVAICTACVVYPENIDFDIRIGAGVTANLADEIVFASKLSHPVQYEQELEQQRQQMNDFEAQAETFITQAFKSITFEEMKNWTMEELMFYLARAEWALRNVWQLPVEFKPKGENEEGDENAIEEEPPTLKEIGDQYRELGYDPMFTLQSEIRAKNKKPHVDFPMIGGTKLLKNEEVLDSVREQVQRLLKR